MLAVGACVGSSRDTTAPEAEGFLRHSDRAGVLADGEVGVEDEVPVGAAGVFAIRNKRKEFGRHY